MKSAHKAHKSLIAPFCLVMFLLPSLHCDKKVTPPDERSPGCFSRQPETLGNTRTFGMAAADVDEDGDKDILIADYLGTSRLWLNEGNGNFTSSPQRFSAQETHDVALTDINGDGHADAIFICHSGTNQIYLNNGAGAFTLSNQQLGSTDSAPQYMDLSDVDGDGDTDLLIYNFNSPNRLWFNDGAAQFTEGTVNLGGSDAKGFEFGDFNGDGTPDLLIIRRQGGNSLELNNGSGTFVQSDAAFGSGGNDAQCVDFDRDNDLDLIIAGDQAVTIWLNQGAGSFQRGPVIPQGALRCGTVDADGDGNWDIITTHIDHGNELWLNNGDGTFSNQGQIFGDAEVHALLCVDLNGDGLSDVVLGFNNNQGGNAVYLNTFAAAN